MALVSWKKLARRFAVEPRWLAWDRRCVRLTGFSFVNRAFEEAGGTSHRPVLLLTTRHHASGRARTIVLPFYADADRFVEVFPSVIAGKTGRHNYTEWDQILLGEGAAHPAMNPYRMPENQACRRGYSKDMCARSLDILNRTIMVPTHPLHGEVEIADTIHNIEVAARVALGGMTREEADIRNAAPVDSQKFDLHGGTVSV